MRRICCCTDTEQARKVLANSRNVPKLRLELHGKRTHRQGSPPCLICEGTKVLVHHVLPWPCPLQLSRLLNPVLEKLQVLVSDVPAPRYALHNYAGQEAKVKRRKDRTRISVELTGHMCRFVLQLCWSSSISDGDKHM